ncbi:MAG: hypothetical protein ACMG50_01975, partial [Thermomonas sp.]
LGETLFEREHHRVTLTPAGEAFRRHAMIVLDDWQRFAGERAPAHGDLSGTLHVYCTVTAAQGIVPAAETSHEIRITDPGQPVCCLLHRFRAGHGRDGPHHARIGSAGKRQQGGGRRAARFGKVRAGGSDVSVGPRLSVVASCTPRPAGDC